MDCHKENKKEIVKNKLILKTQEVQMMIKNAITWWDRNNAYGTRKDLICKKEKNKRNNVIKQEKNV